MDDSSFFRQKPRTTVSRGFQAAAVDASPSELSGASSAPTPIWERFVTNTDMVDSNRGAVQAEESLIREAGRNRKPDLSIFDQADPETLGDDPVWGGEARRRVRERDLDEARNDYKGTRLAMDDPAWSGRLLPKTKREEIEMEGSMLAETDPRHKELKAKLIADDQARAERADLERKAYDAKVRAFEIEKSDPDSWWARRGAPPSPDPVAVAQSQRSEADAAHESALEEQAALREKLRVGVPGAEVGQIRERMAAIDNAMAVAGEKKIEAQGQIEGVRQEAEKAKPFFGFGDTISGIWDAVKSLGTGAPEAFYQLVEGLDRPDQYSESAKKAFAEADAFRKEMQAKTAANQAAGTSTSVGESIREGGQSLAGSLGTLVASIPAAKAAFHPGGVAGAAIAAIGGQTGPQVAAPEEIVTVPAGYAIGGAIASGAAAMAVSGGAMYRMAGASFLNEAFQSLEAESMRQNGRPMNESEKADAYGKLLPIAKNTALWEAGPEAVSNAVTLGAGSIVLGLGKPLAEKFAAAGFKKAAQVAATTGGKAAIKGAAFLGEVGTELGTETLTQVEQGADQLKAQAIAQGKDPDAIQAQWNAPGVIDAFKEVAPQTLGLLGLTWGAGGAVKAASMGVDAIRKKEAETPGADPVSLTTTAIRAIDPEAPAPSAEEVSKAAMIVNPNAGPEGLADAVLIERELTAVSMQDDEALAAATAGVEAAKATGDTKAIKAAEEAVAGVRGRAEGVRAVLKVAAGQGVGDLTGAELKSLGLNRDASTGAIAPMSDKELEQAGLSDLLVTVGDDGSLVLTDEALKRVEEVSPRARGRINLTEAEAIQKARERANTPTWEVQTREGPVSVRAANADTAEREVAGTGKMIVPGSAKQVSPSPVGDSAAASGEAAAVNPAAGNPPITNDEKGQPQSQTGAPADQAGVAGDQAGVAGGNPASVTPAPTAAPSVNPSQPGVPNPSGASAPGNQAPQGTPAPAGGELTALATALKSFTKAKKKLKDRLVEGPARAETRPEGITINPAQIIDEALQRRMTDKQAAEYFDRVLDEEIRHLAQYDAAKVLYRNAKATEPFLEWMEAHYAGIWQTDFVATGKDAIIRDIYANSEAEWNALSNGNKALEAIRMMSQGKAITEQGKLWANISDTLRKALTAALAALKQFSDIASPTLKSEIQNLENALKQLQSSQPRAGTSKTGGEKSADSKTSAGNGGTSKDDGNLPTPSDGGTGPSPSDVTGSPLQPSARVEFEAHDGRPAGTGKVRIARGDAVSVYPDSDPTESWLVPLAKVREIVPQKPANDLKSGQEGKDDDLNQPSEDQPPVSPEGKSERPAEASAEGAVEEVPRLNEAAGWQVRNANLGEAYKAAKREVDQIEARIRDISNREETALPSGFQTIPYEEGTVALQDDDGNDIAFPLTPAEASYRAWQMDGGNRYAESDALAAELADELAAARQRMKAASDAWNANGQSPDAGKWKAEADVKAAAEQKKAASTAKAKRTRDGNKRSRNAGSRTLDLFTANSFVQEIIRQGGMMSASRASKEMGEAWWAENKSQYDDAPTFKNPTFNVIYSRDGQYTPNRMAQALADEGLMADGDVNRMWAELFKAGESTTNINKQVGREIEKSKADEARAAAFAEANQEKLGATMAIMAGDLDPNNEEYSTFTVGGEVFTVTAKSEYSITAKDGEKFGTQIIPTDEMIWAEINTDDFLAGEDIEAIASAIVDETEKQGYESVDDREQADREGNRQENGPEGSPSGEARGSDGVPQGGSQAQGSQIQVKIPASKMDVRNQDSRELFSDDGGFSLVSDTTQDGDKIAAERKAKEEAKAAQDAAQRDMFFTPPAQPQAGKDAAQKGKTPIVLWGRKQSMGGDWIRLTDNISNAEVKRREAEGWEVIKYPANQNPGDIEKSPREARIERIVAASRRPMLDIVEVQELKGSDGKWYRPNGVPLGVQNTGEYRTIGYAFNDKGVNVGTTRPTRQDLVADWKKAEDAKAETFRKALSEMTDEMIAEQAAYWLNEKPLRTIPVRLREAEQRLRKRFPDGFEIKDARAAFAAEDRDYSYFGASTLVDWLKSEGAIVDSKESGRTMDTPGFDGWKWTGKEAKNDYTEESVSPTAVESTEGIESFSPEQAASELAKRGITVQQEATKTGESVWRIKGKTFDVKDALKSLGAKWYAPAKSWSIFSDEDPTAKIANALAGKATPGTSSAPAQDNAGAGRDADEDLRLQQLRERLDGTSDERRARGDAVASVSADTANLIRRGLNFGMPEDVVEDQIEDIAMIGNAYDTGKPMFLLGNGAGTGKTFVLGGAIRELRAKGAGPFVYVTMNTDLIEQIKRDLADYGVGDVSFHTYSEASTKGISVPKDGVLIFDEAHNVKNEDSARGAKGQAMMGNAKFTIFASATPFENPVQASYLAGTGIFNEAGGHTQWGKAYGASVRKFKVMTPYGLEEREELYWQNGKLEDGLAARQWFTKQGIMVTRPMRLPMEMVESQFSKRAVDQKFVDIYDKVEAAYDEAMATFRDEDGNITDARNNSQVAMHQVNTVKRILEAAKVDHAVEEAQRILAGGGNVVIFVETKADRWIGRYRASQFFEKNGPLYRYPEMRSMIAAWMRAKEMAYAMNEKAPPRPFSEAIMQIARAMHEAGLEYELPSVEQEIVERLGGKDKVGIYTGSVSNAAAAKDKEAFLAGKKKVIVATMAKGGTGLSLHDKVGNRPTFQVNINLPWVATAVDQVSGRVARYGLQSKANINWLFADNIAFERMLASRVGRRMRDMGAVVKGIDMKAAQVLTEGFDFDSVADVKQESGEIEVAEDDIFEVAAKLEKSRRQRGDQSSGFFETPFTLSALMTAITGARGKLLEPSAGRGNLVRFAKGKAKSITLVEIRPDNVNYLTGQFGDSVIEGDFMEMETLVGLYDSIHMNPPFERKAGVGWQDMAHVTKAFSKHLESDGRLVAIVGEGGFFRSDKQSQEFRQFLDDNGAMVIKLPEGAFKNSNTGVRTRMIVMDRNAESGRTDINLSDMDPDSLRSVAESVPARESSGLQASPLPRLRADSPEWKAMSKDERKAYLKSGLRAAGLPTSPVPIRPGNYWLNPNGEFLRLMPHQTHDTAAAFHLGERMTNYGPGTPYHNRLVAKGWVRIATENDNIYATQEDGNPLKLTRAQKTSLEDQSFEGWNVLGSGGHSIYEKKNRGLRASPLPSAAPPFYSQLSRVIEAKMPKRATPAQVVQIAASGAKAEEVKWSGLIPWLQGRDKVSKAEVLDWLAGEGAVRFEEVALNGENRPTEFYDSEDFDALPQEAREIISRYDENEDYSNPRMAQELAAVGVEIEIGMGGGITSVRVIGSESSPTRFAKYQLPGGENYREVVLAMPRPMKEREFYESRGITEEEWNAMDERAKQHARDRYREASATYTSSHFPDVPNYVAHMRLNERDNGLFIEELQSDRHQAGREKGYAGDDTRGKELYNIAKRYRSLSTNPDITQEDSQKILVDLNARLKAINATASDIEPVLQEYGDFTHPFKGDFGVADAPYRKDWPLALFKRALRDAVASGKEWIGWTVGETQNDRYDLSKQVDSIEWTHDNGEWELQIETPQGPISRFIDSEQELADTIGKELAERIVKATDEGKKSDKYSGDGLKIGGSGMKGFYDTILPKEIGKYVKQWGGKVEKGSIAGRQNPDGLEVVAEDGTTIATTEYDSEAWRIARENPGATVRPTTTGSASTPIWRIDITPEMRKGVQAGQALFASPLPEPSAPKRARDAFERNRALFENAQAQVRALGSGTAGASPEFANPGSTPEARDQFDIARMIDSHQREVRKDRDTHSRGREYLEKFPEEVERLLVESAYGETTERIDDYQQHAINLLLDRKAQEASSQEDFENLAALATANIIVGREAGRMLRQRMDRFLKPEERARAAIADAIFTPTKRVAARAEVMAPKARKEFMAEESKKRIEQVEKELKKLGVRLDQILGKNRDLQLANSKLEKDMLKMRNAMEQDIIRFVQKGASMADIRRRFGKLGAEQAADIIAKARQDLFDRIKEMAAQGMDREAIRNAMRDSLKAAPLTPGKGMTDAEIWQMIDQDFGIPDAIPEKPLPSIKRKAKVESEIETHPLSANWSRPEFSDFMRKVVFDTKDRAGIMKRVEIIRGLAGALGKINNLTGEKRKEAEKRLGEINAILEKYGTDAAGIFEASKGIEDYRFDITDIAQVAAVARTINALDADIVDKATEYLYASMLSGLQTMLVNATAIVPAAWESTVGRGVSMAINRFVKDPMAEQYGEGKYIVRALAPAIKRAQSNFVASMAAQHPMFDRDVNAMEIDWDKILGGGSHRMIGSIKGRKGDIIRLPMRLLTATDDFNRTLIACAEVGTFAYRLALVDSKNEKSPNFGMKPGDAKFDKFITAEVNTPGSISYQLASQKASKAIYSNPLPGQRDPHTGKAVPVRDMGDVVGYIAGKLTDAVAGDHDNIFVKALSSALRIAFFPFQRTPFNIIRKGVRHTLNPFSLADIALGVVRNAKNEQGKWEWAIKGDDEAAMKRHLHRAELIERMGQQLQGAVLMTALMALAWGEGDDDDQEKDFIITGSSPFLPTGRAERDARMRSGIGPYRFSWRNKDGSERVGFSYGRIEPIATILSATIDTIKSVKREQRAGKDTYDATMAAMGGLVSQAQDKTFMKGISDFIAISTSVMAEPDLRENRKALQFLAGRTAMVVPNIIKQPIREADPMFRERSEGFMQELLYQAVPYGQKPAKIDPYGQLVTKPGNAAVRMLDVGDTGADKVNPYDAALLRWSDKNPGKAWFPSPILNGKFKNAAGKEVEMNQAQLAEFKDLAGKRVAARLKREAVNLTNPSELDVERIKKAHTEARSEAKKMIAMKYSRP